MHHTTTTTTTAIRQTLTTKDLLSVLGPSNYTRLQKKTGYHRTHIGRVLKGQAKASIDCLRALSRASGVSVDDILSFIDAVNKARLAMVVEVVEVTEKVEE